MRKLQFLFHLLQFQYYHGKRWVSASLEILFDIFLLDGWYEMPHSNWELSFSLDTSLSLEFLESQQRIAGIPIESITRRNILIGLRLKTKSERQNFENNFHRFLRKTNIWQQYLFKFIVWFYLKLSVKRICEMESHVKNR